MEISARTKRVIEHQLGDARVTKDKLISLLMMAIRSSNGYCTEDRLVNNIATFVTGACAYDELNKDKVLEYINKNYRHVINTEATDLKVLFFNPINDNLYLKIKGTNEDGMIVEGELNVNPNYI